MANPADHTSDFDVRWSDEPSCHVVTEAELNLLRAAFFAWAGDEKVADAAQPGRPCHHAEATGEEEAQ